MSTARRAALARVVASIAHVRERAQSHEAPPPPDRALTGEVTTGSLRSINANGFVIRFFLPGEPCGGRGKGLQ